MKNLFDIIYQITNIIVSKWNQQCAENPKQDKSLFGRQIVLDDEDNEQHPQIPPGLESLFGIPFPDRQAVRANQIWGDTPIIK